MVHLNKHGGGVVEDSREQKLACVLEALIAETGHCGPFILGSTHCNLCGHVAHQIEPVALAEAVKDLYYRCDRCSQDTVSYLALNGEPDA